MRNGCHDHEPYKDSFTTVGVDSKTGINKTFTIPNPNTKDCNYTHTELGKLDKGCIGCKWKGQTNE